MSHAQRTTSRLAPPDKRRRIGGPLQATPEDSPNPEVEDVGSESGGAGDSDAESQGDTRRAKTGSAQGPATRSTTRMTASAAQGRSGKEEASPSPTPARGKGKTQKRGAETQLTSLAGKELGGHGATSKDSVAC